MRIPPLCVGCGAPMLETGARDPWCRRTFVCVQARCAGARGSSVQVSDHDEITTTDTAFGDDMSYSQRLRCRRCGATRTP
ncbi:MAG: hypothetical protein ACEQSX_13920 [Baekduiaceae bacterium]